MNPCPQNLVKKNLVKLLVPLSAQVLRMLHRDLVSHHSFTWSSQVGYKSHFSTPGRWLWGDGAERCRAALRGWAASTFYGQLPLSVIGVIRGNATVSLQAVAELLRRAQHFLIYPLKIAHNHILKPKADVEGVPFKEVYGILSTNQRPLFCRFAAILPLQQSFHHKVAQETFLQKKPSTKSIILLF